MEQLCTNKLDNLGEMNKFLEGHKLLKLTQHEIENLNRLITSKKIQSVIKKNFYHEEKPRTLWLHWYILPNI